MKAEADALLAEALKLSEADRAYMVSELLASLEETEDDSDADAAWALELDRRMQEIEGGTVRPIPWEEVKEFAARRARARD